MDLPSVQRTIVELADADQCVKLCATRRPQLVCLSVRSEGVPLGRNGVLTGAMGHAQCLTAHLYELRLHLGAQPSQPIHTHQ